VVSEGCSVFFRIILKKTKCQEIDWRLAFVGHSSMARAGSRHPKSEGDFPESLADAPGAREDGSVPGGMG
jgi:hypothetical protein